MAREEDDSSSGLDLSSSDDDEENAMQPPPKALPKKKKGALSYEELMEHGYAGGLSILNVPAPKQAAGEQHWSWSSGNASKRRAEDESFEERERTREAANEGAEQRSAEVLNEYAVSKKQRKDAAAEERKLSFSKKEKRKRDMGQASRGKNYVEEEKRLLRDHKVYSGFD